MKFQAIFVAVATAITAVNAQTAWCVQGNLACASACNWAGYGCYENPGRGNEYCCAKPE